MDKPPLDETEHVVRLTRRRWLTAGVAVPLASAGATVVLPHEVPWAEGRADMPPEALADGSAAKRAGYGYFQPAEAAFVEAAVARLIPADDNGPGAMEAGVPVFIDRQLAGEYGRGGRWYMQGPWARGEATQGYQSRLTPAAMYRAAIREIDQAVASAGGSKGFAGLPHDQQDDWLHKLENGDITLQTVDAKAYFQLLLQNTFEGFWCDPIYGGNRGMVGWKLIGFPGARYDHSPYVSEHGKPYPLPPVGISGRPEWNQG